MPPKVARKVLKKVSVWIDENDPFVTGEILAEEILKLSKGFEKIANSRLTQDTIVLLLHDKTKVRKADIRYILNAIPILGKSYLKPQ